MGKGKQYRIEKLKALIRARQSCLSLEIDRLEKRYNKLSKIEASLDDPHAVVPNTISSIENWLKDHPYPLLVLSNIFKNKKEAFDYQLFSHTLMYEFHIVKCKSKEYYQSKLEEGHENN